MTTKVNYQNIDYEDFDEPLCEYHNGELLKGIYDYGFEKPSIIQAKCFKPIADGKDLIAQAQSGSGKTGAFTIGTLMKIDNTKKYPQGVIIANTKELASQIKDVVKEIGKHMNIKVTLCVGGIENDNRSDIVIKEAEISQILVCTPGRLNGLIKKNENLLDNLKIFILDEADQLLSADFLPQIQGILKSIPENTQICLFSATTNSRNIRDTKKHFMNHPIELHIEKEKIRVDAIKNYIVDAEEEKNKYGILVDLYKNINICQAVIFVNTIEKANFLANKLKHDEHSVGIIHSGLSDFERTETLKKFRRTYTRILVATDVIARGIDVQQVGLVINYDIPYGEGYMEKYIHRVGRSGRYGKLGVAINIVSNDNKKSDWYKLKSISEEYSVRMASLPELEEINYYLSGVNGYNFKEKTKDN
jgi:translation initiation factor 4A